MTPAMNADDLIVDIKPLNNTWADLGPQGCDMAGVPPPVEDLLGDQTGTKVRPPAMAATPVGGVPGQVSCLVVRLLGVK